MTLYFDDKTMLPSKEGAPAQEPPQMSKSNSTDDGYVHPGDEKLKPRVMKHGLLVDPDQLNQVGKSASKPAPKTTPKR